MFGLFLTPLKYSFHSDQRLDIQALSFCAIDTILSLSKNYTLDRIQEIDLERKENHVQVHFIWSASAHVLLHFSWV